MGIWVAVLGVMLGVGPATQPLPLSQAFSIADGITIFLPNGWRRVPKDVVDAFNDRTKGVPDASSQKFDYVFQRWPAGGGLKPPVIMVQIRSGRISDPGSLRRYLRESILNRSKEVQGGSHLPDPQFEDAPSTPPGTAAWIRWQFKTGIEIQAAMLTQTGIVCVIGCCSQADAPQCVPLYESILRSVAIAESVRYRPCPVGQARLKSASAALVGWALIGFVAMIVIFAVRRRMRRTMRALGVVFIALAYLTIPGMIGSFAQEAGSSTPMSPERVAYFVADLVFAVFWVPFCFSLGRYLRRKGEPAPLATPVA